MIKARSLIRLWREAVGPLVLGRPAEKLARGFQIEARQDDVPAGRIDDGEAHVDKSGRSVSISSDGTTVAIGAHYNDGNGTNSGHVRVYKNISSTWTKQGADIDSEADVDQSGTSVSISPISMVSRG